MNNCPKCGNPLEPGVTTCPICGNNLVNTPETNVVNNNVVAGSPEVLAPVTENKVDNQVVNVNVTPNEQGAIVNNSAPALASVTPESPVVTEVAPATEASAQVSNASAGKQEKLANDSQTPLVKDEDVKPKKKKKPFLLIILLLLVVGGIGTMMFLNGSKPATSTDNKPKTETIAVASNGYKFDLPKTWFLTEDSRNVVITNEDSTVSIKLDQSESTLSDLNEEIIKKALATHEDYTDTSVSKIKISAKDAYLVNTKINKMPVQIYFINGGSRLLIGVTVVYHTDEAKTEYEAMVTEMIGTLSYANEEVKALDIINMYSNAFNIYNSVINYHEIEESEESLPSEEESENNNEIIEDNNLENTPENN